MIAIGITKSFYFCKMSKNVLFSCSCIQNLQKVQILYDPQKMFSSKLVQCFKIPEFYADSKFIEGLKKFSGKKF
jgi:hypothetical protein